MERKSDASILSGAINTTIDMFRIPSHEEVFYEDEPLELSFSNQHIDLVDDEGRLYRVSRNKYAGALFKDHALEFFEVSLSHQDEEGNLDFYVFPSSEEIMVAADYRDEVDTQSLRIVAQFIVSAANRQYERNAETLRCISARLRDEYMNELQSARERRENTKDFQLDIPSYDFVSGRSINLSLYTHEDCLYARISVECDDVEYCYEFDVDTDNSLYYFVNGDEEEEVDVSGLSGDVDEFCRLCGIFLS